MTKGKFMWKKWETPSEMKMKVSQVWLKERLMNLYTGGLKLIIWPIINQIVQKKNYWSKFFDNTNSFMYLCFSTEDGWFWCLKCRWTTLTLQRSCIKSTVRLVSSLLFNLVNLASTCFKFILNILFFSLADS